MELCNGCEFGSNPEVIDAMRKHAINLAMAPRREGQIAQIAQMRRDMIEETGSEAYFEGLQRDQQALRRSNEVSPIVEAIEKGNCSGPEPKAGVLNVMRAACGRGGPRRCGNLSLRKVMGDENVGDKNKDEEDDDLLVA